MMSAAHRCQTCVCCGQPFRDGERTDIEVILEADAPAHYVAVIWGHSSFTEKRGTDETSSVQKRG